MITTRQPFATLHCGAQRGEGSIVSRLLSRYRLVTPAVKLTVGHAFYAFSRSDLPNGEHDAEFYIEQIKIVVEAVTDGSSSCLLCTAWHCAESLWFSIL